MREGKEKGPADRSAGLPLDRWLVDDRADQLANELSQVKPELKARGCAVRVTDIDRRELYRTPLDPVPRWRRIG